MSPPSATADAGAAHGISFREGTPLGDLYQRRVDNSADMVVVVSDYHNRRGTGKTICSLKAAASMDRTDAGITKEKVTLAPEELIQAYTEQPQGSALVLDEAEAGISNRSAMTNVNKAVRQIISMGRVEEKYVVLNAPASSHIDKSVKELADVWILVQRRGAALVYFFKYNPFGEHAITEKKQKLFWDDIETGTHLRDVYNHLTRVKRKKLRGEAEDGYIPSDEHKEKLKKAKRQARRDERDTRIRRLVNGEGLRASDIADSFELTPQRIGQIARGE